MIGPYFCGVLAAILATCAFPDDTPKSIAFTLIWALMLTFATRIDRKHFGCKHD